MKKHLLVTLFFLVSASMSYAQGSDDYHKIEAYGGFSTNHVESNLNQGSFTSGGATQTFTNLCSTATGEEIGPNSQKFFCTRRNFNGFDGSITFNVSRYVGLKANVTGHFKSQSYLDRFNPPGVAQTLLNHERLYQFLGGVQLKRSEEHTSELQSHSDLVCR